MWLSSLCGRKTDSLVFQLLDLVEGLQGDFGPLGILPGARQISNSQAIAGRDTRSRLHESPPKC